MINKEEQFKQIVKDNEERVRRICRYYSNCNEESKDMYQEILINIWKSLDSYRGEAAISTWIYRIAINTSLSMSGKTFKQLKFRVDMDMQHLGSLIDDNGAEQKKLLEKQLDRMQTQINQLTIIDKALISLLLEGLSSKEIANVVGLTEPNVRVKIHRIKESLRKSFGSGDLEQGQTSENELP
ncbi:RNA polymerase sigma factor [Sunxiuqinia indica]|uniref:RNA polymerase sigma factor n=1 Tax=Sunxiuqinia indica TaxID=2692584 RepID=UPI00135B4627|nr:sigma-70 family RNA polymerase sigma factor [Sunxiuqinia indica]